MKYISVLCSLLVVGCNHSNKSLEGIDFPIPPPPPNIFPFSPPPSFTPNTERLALMKQKFEDVEVQINPIPHPFNVNGNIPYVVWVNGERLPLNSIEIRALAQSLNLKFEQPKDTAEIHSGAGWTRPLKLEKTQDVDLEFAEEEIFIDVE